MKLRIAARAIADVAAIEKYLSVQSQLAQERFRLRLSEVLAMARDHPWSGRATDRDGIRMMNTHPYPYLVF